MNDSKFTTSDEKHGFCSMTFAPFWFVLHMVSLDYPITPTRAERQLYTQWFENMGKVLPCSVCRGNFENNLKALNPKYNPLIDFASRTTFAHLVWRLHNKINEDLNKHIQVTWDNFKSFYEQLRATDCSGDSCKSTRVGPQCTLKVVREGSVAPDELFSNVNSYPQCPPMCIKPIQMNVSKPIQMKEQGEEKKLFF